jgi:hypothetical protein
MNSIDLLFRSSRFNLSKVGDHFINPCCFGEDFSAWLGQKLAERGIAADPPGQEDWGWYLGLSRNGARYLVGVSGNADESSAHENDGQWRVMVDKSRSFGERLRGAGKIAEDDPIVALLEEILGGQADFFDLHREPSR